MTGSETLSSGTELDFSQTTPAATSAGWTKDQRESLDSDALVKFRESFVRSIIKVPLSSNIHLTSYKPTEMGDKSNFFNAISGWSQASLKFNAWMRTHFVTNVFNVISITRTPNTTAGGPDTVDVSDLGSLFEVWHSLTLKQVFDSCQLYMKFSKSSIEAQNLNLSWELIMNNVDSDLQATIIAEVSQYTQDDADCAQSGPMAFFVVANRSHCPRAKTPRARNKEQPATTEEQKEQTSN